jgi:hypothetical protein
MPMAGDLDMGDRVRVTPQCRVPSCAPGDTGTVLRVTRDPRTCLVINYAVQMDRGEAGIAFRPGEVEWAP